MFDFFFYILFYCKGSGFLTVCSCIECVDNLYWWWMFEMMLKPKTVFTDFCCQNPQKQKEKFIFIWIAGKSSFGVSQFDFGRSFTPLTESSRLETFTGPDSSGSPRQTNLRGGRGLKSKKVVWCQSVCRQTSSFRFSCLLSWKKTFSVWGRIFKDRTVRRLFLSFLTAECFNTLRIESTVWLSLWWNRRGSGWRTVKHIRFYSWSDWNLVSCCV